MLRYKVLLKRLLPLLIALCFAQAAFVLAYAAAWLLFNLGRMPPHIPGATTDPTFASPE